MWGGTSVSIVADCDFSLLQRSRVQRHGILGQLCVPGSGALSCCRWSQWQHRVRHLLLLCRLGESLFSSLFPASDPLPPFPLNVYSPQCTLLSPQGNDTECISTRVYSTTAHGISMGVQAFFREGESCSKGTCSASECTNDKNVQGWIKDNWPVVVGMILGSILLLWLAHVTYRRENIEDLRPKRFSLRRQESVQMTPASSQQARQQPKLASIARPGSQQAVCLGKGVGGLRRASNNLHTAAFLHDLLALTAYSLSCCLQGAGAPRGKMRKGELVAGQGAGGVPGGGGARGLGTVPPTSSSPLSIIRPPPQVTHASA